MAGIKSDDEDCKEPGNRLSCDLCGRIFLQHRLPVKLFPIQQSRFDGEDWFCQYCIYEGGKESCVKPGHLFHLFWAGDNKWYTCRVVKRVSAEEVEVEFLMKDRFKGLTERIKLGDESVHYIAQSRPDHLANGKYSHRVSNLWEKQKSNEDEKESMDDSKVVIARRGSMLQTYARQDLNPWGTEYLIKWNDKSHIHCSWIPHESIADNHHKINSWRKSREGKGLRLYSGSKEPCYFNPEFKRISRIVHHRKYRNSQEYLVRWRRLPYSKCTWEKATTLLTLCPNNAADAIEKYHKLLDCLPKGPHSINDKRAPASDNVKWLAAKLQLKTGKLKSYQEEGVGWLAFNWHLKQNVLLADEMGLGKTVQTVALFHYLAIEQGIRGPFLVVAPLSTLVHWAREVERFTNLYSVIYHGSSVARKVIQEYEVPIYQADGRSKIPGEFKFNVLITSYDMLNLGRKFLRNIHWRCLVVDEAHRMKNRESLLYRNLVELKTDHHFLLSGTPIQNNVNELWSLLHFLDKEHFNDFPQFEKKFREVTQASQMEELKTFLGPYVLRRMKSDVETAIKPRREVLVYVELPQAQKALYRAVYENNAKFLMDSTKTLCNLRNVAMQLRKVCNHPYLIDGVESTRLSKLKILASKQHLIMKELVQMSGKFVLLSKLLPKLKRDGHKVLIYSQFTNLLDILEDYISWLGHIYERIDGSKLGIDRQEAIDRFSNDQERFIFLLSTKAGGVGINLTAADTVIIFDSDWNPQNDIQAQARCHRIGQTRTVTVYRLITRGTYETEMYRRAAKKLALDGAVLHSMKAKKKQSKAMDKKEMDEVLRVAALSLLSKDDSESVKFMSDDIDTILSRAEVVEVEGGSSILKSQSALSKATFVPRNSSTKVKVNDPKFWQKMGLKPAITPSSKSFIIPYKRKREKVNYVVKQKLSLTDTESSSDTEQQSRSKKRKISSDASEAYTIETEEKTPSSPEIEAKRGNINKLPRNTSLSFPANGKKKGNVKKKRPRKKKRPFTVDDAFNAVRLFQQQQKQVPVFQDLPYYCRTYTQWNANPYYCNGPRALVKSQVNTINITQSWQRKGELATANFSSGHSQWRILVYVFGKHQDEGMSVYLQHHKFTKAGKTYQDAEFKCTINHRTMPSKNHCREMRHKFTKKRDCCGFDIFIPLHELFYGGYLCGERRDTIVLRTEVWCYPEGIDLPATPPMNDGLHYGYAASAQTRTFVKPIPQVNNVVDLMQDDDLKPPKDLAHVHSINTTPLPLLDSVVQKINCTPFVSPVMTDNILAKYPSMGVPSLKADPKDIKPVNSVSPTNTEKSSEQLSSSEKRPPARVVIDLLDSDSEEALPTVATKEPSPTVSTWSGIKPNSAGERMSGEPRSDRFTLNVVNNAVVSPIVPTKINSNELKAKAQSNSQASFCPKKSKTPVPMVSASLPVQPISDCSSEDPCNVNKSASFSERSHCKSSTNEIIIHTKSPVPSSPDLPSIPKKSIDFPVKSMMSSQNESEGLLQERMSSGETTDRPTNSPPAKKTVPSLPNTTTSMDEVKEGSIVFKAKPSIEPLSEKKSVTTNPSSSESKNNVSSLRTISLPAPVSSTQSLMSGEKVGPVNEVEEGCSLQTIKSLAVPSLNTKAVSPKPSPPVNKDNLSSSRIVSVSPVSSSQSLMSGEKIGPVNEVGEGCSAQVTKSSGEPLSNTKAVSLKPSPPESKENLSSPRTVSVSPPVSSSQILTVGEKIGPVNEVEEGCFVQTTKSSAGPLSNTEVVSPKPSPLESKDNLSSSRTISMSPLVSSTQSLKSGEEIGPVNDVEEDCFVQTTKSSAGPLSNPKAVSPKPSLPESKESLSSSRAVSMSPPVSLTQSLMSGETTAPVKIDEECCPVLTTKSSEGPLSNTKAVSPNPAPPEITESLSSMPSPISSTQSLMSGETTGPVKEVEEGRSVLTAKSSVGPLLNTKISSPNHLSPDCKDNVEDSRNIPKAQPACTAKRTMSGETISYQSSSPDRGTDIDLSGPAVTGSSFPSLKPGKTTAKLSLGVETSSDGKSVEVGCMPEVIAQEPDRVVRELSHKKVVLLDSGSTSKSTTFPSSPTSVTVSDISVSKKIISNIQKAATVKTHESSTPVPDVTSTQTIESTSTSALQPPIALPKLSCQESSSVQKKVTDTVVVDSTEQLDHLACACPGNVVPNKTSAVGSCAVNSEKGEGMTVSNCSKKNQSSNGLEPLADLKKLQPNECKGIEEEHKTKSSSVSSTDRNADS